MRWMIDFHPLFFEEAGQFSRAVKKALQEEIEILEAVGPMLGRPQVDTLNGSQYSNMKELRFNADNGVLRSRLILSDKQFYSWEATKPEPIRNAFTDN